MFNECTKLSYISPVKDWNVSNGKNFEGMFYNCPGDIDALKIWNISKDKFDSMQKNKK